ncbi:MAG: ACT domain-containing protein [Actinomycetota bacterium]
MCRLPVSAPWPTPTSTSGFWSVTRTSDELSIVCPQEATPVGAAVMVEPDWRVLEVEGPLDFSMVGVMARITASLADAGISVFVTSTYDTDYVLVRSAAVERAIEALRSAGHEVDAG